MINWAAYVEAAMEHYVLSQDKFAETIGLTQQSVSNWKKGARIPNGYRQKQMRKHFPDISPDDYILPEDAQADIRDLATYRAFQHDVRAFCKRMSEVKKRKRVKVFNDLGPLVDKAEEQRQASIALRARVLAKRV